MKIIHLSDLHIGKKVNNFSMIEDQKYILTEILKIIDKESPHVIIIAGDIYDKSVPPVDAVELFDDFLFELTNRHLNVLIISGNHDSATRLSFGSKIFDSRKIYISPTYNGEIKKVGLLDEFGEINFYLLPFIKPSNVRYYYPSEEISSYTDALNTIIKNINIDKKKRNVLITHQFVTGASRSDSEEISVGGSDNVDGEIFKDFDYVALGHIHRPQSIIRDTIRYCGTPLKYSFSEASHKKSVTIVNLFEKNNIQIETKNLVPMRDMVEIKGNYMDITSKSFYDDLNTDDYFHITLTDEEDIIDAVSKLRTIYPNIMRLDYDNTRTKNNNIIENLAKIDNKNPNELFSEFYYLQNNKDTNKEQSEFIKNLIENIWEEGK